MVIIMKILISEADLISRKFLSKLLSKYGECDLVSDDLEALDAFLLALKVQVPYHLICMDIMMPKASEVKTLKVIRELEKQYGVAQKKRVKIIMTTTLAEAQLVQTSLDSGFEAYATKPIDSQKLIAMMVKLGLIVKTQQAEYEETALRERYDKKTKFTTKHGMQKNSFLLKMTSKEKGYFKSVRALPDYRLEVIMETDTVIHFDFSSRLDTSRFGRLRGDDLFKSVRTDGNYLIFEKAGKMSVKITATEFMDLVLIDRRR